MRDGCGGQRAQEGGRLWATRHASSIAAAAGCAARHAQRAPQADLAMMVWLLRGGGRTVLVDAGFYRDKFVARWKPRDLVRPSEALAPLGVKPEDVTDVVITHIHWDHADGADLLPNARVWIPRDEVEHHMDDSGAVRDRAIDADDARMLAAIRRAGRLRLVAGDSVEILPGITVFTGGKHTFASQFLTARTRAGTVVLASDNAYRYENLDHRRPIAQTLDSLSNLRVQARMFRLATSSRLIVPGHDMAVLARLPLVAPSAARISYAGRERLAEYHVHAAPDSLSRPAMPPVTAGVPGFRVRIPELRIASPMVTLAPAHLDHT